MLSLMLVVWVYVSGCLLFYVCLLVLFCVLVVVMVFG